MNTKYPYLTDASFLDFFAHHRLKEQIVKITVLDWQEHPIADIQGRTSTGSLSVDGQSTVRRTANLTFLVSEDSYSVTDNTNLISVGRKAQLQVGFINNTPYYKSYSILWFPLGVFVITDASLSNGSGGVTISLQLKDKMCLLNGECGGTIGASTTFHEYDYINEKGEVEISQPTIVQIIQEVVNHFGGEQLSKIIIGGLDTRIKKVVKWVGSSNIFLVKTTDKTGTREEEVNYTTKTQTIQDIYEEMELSDSNTSTHTVTQFSQGDDIGYIYESFYYPGELVADAGQTVTDVLDKIKETLGNFEYFYDLDGNFIFQEIQNYLNKKYTSTIIEQLNTSANPYILDTTKGKTVYRFDDDSIISSYSNSPQFNMIKNDFIVWGKRKSSDGKEFPIRYHLALDTKPAIGNFYHVLLYTDPRDGIEKVIAPIACGLKKYLPEYGTNQCYYSYFDITIKKENNTEKLEVKPMIVRWNESKQQYIAVDISGETEANVIQYDNCIIQANDWRTEIYLQGAIAANHGTATNYYYPELQNEWTKLYQLNKYSLILNNEITFDGKDISIQSLKDIKSFGIINNQQFQQFENETLDLYAIALAMGIDYNSLEQEIAVSIQNFILSNMKVYRGGFKDEVLQKPSTVDYFLDFIDTGEVFNAMNVNVIGRRTKVLNDDKVNCVFASDIPDYVLIEKGITENKAYGFLKDQTTAMARQECLEKGQPYIQVDTDIYEALGTGGYLNDAYTTIKDLLYQHTEYNESISINCLPLYCLEPNTRIGVYDKLTGIQGDYIITSYSIPLDISATMTISATKAIDRI